MAEAKEEEEKIPTTGDPFKDYINRVNHQYKGSIIQAGDAVARAGLNLRRFSSGIVSLDCVLGGGWPFSRICIVAGEYSTGKTLIALKAAKSINNFDHVNHVRKDLLADPTKFEPCRTLFVDVEGTFDEKWAIANGWDVSLNAVAKTEYAEQAIDIVTDAIRSNVFDLIIVDSIAALTPSKEIEESSEDWQMGLGARLTNKAMRRWNASLCKLSQYSKSGGPCVLCLNQFRLKLGVMYGDPRTMPNGKGQEFAASVIVYTRSAQLEDDTKAEHGFVELGGVTYKNKTFVSKCNYKFRLALKDHPDWKTGEVDNYKQLIALGKKYNLIEKNGSKGWKVGSDEFKNLDEIEGRIFKDPAFELLLWRSCVSAFGGQIV